MVTKTTPTTTAAEAVDATATKTTATATTTTAATTQPYLFLITILAESSITDYTISIPPTGGWPTEFWTDCGAGIPKLTLSAFPEFTFKPDAASNPTTISTSKGTTTKGASSTSAKGSKCPSPGNSGLTTGPAVGLAFGCLFAGALLVLALGFFCLRRRETFAKQSLFRGQPVSPSKGGNGVIPLTKSSSNSSAHVLEKLPAPITHSQFAKEASQWNTNIKNYLDNHADLVTDLSMARGQTLLAGEQLSTLAGHDAPWHRLLRDKASRYNALHMLIARIIANRVDPETAAEASLLPQSVLRAYQDIVAGEKQNPDVLIMQNIWRAMTMKLISTTYQTSTAASLATSPKYPSIRETAKTIHDALAPLLLRRSEPGADSEVHSLVDVVAKGTLLGLRMFEQSNPTRFFWQTGDETRDRSSKEPLIVFPGIKQRKMQPGSRESVIVPPVRA